MHVLSCKITFEEEFKKERKKAGAHIHCATTRAADIKQICTLRLCHLFILERGARLCDTFSLPSLRNRQTLRETIQLDKVTRLDADPVAACFLSLRFLPQIVCISKSGLFVFLIAYAKNTMWHNTIWAPCEKNGIISGRDCRRRVTVITFFQERGRDSLTTWPAVIIYPLWQYLCVWLDFLFSLRWIRNEFGNGINK